MQQTLVLLKPDAIQRGLVGEIISQLKQRGLKLTAMKLMQVTDELAHEHYAEHIEKPFSKGW